MGRETFSLLKGQWELSKRVSAATVTDNEAPSQASTYYNGNSDLGFFTVTEHDTSGAEEASGEAATE
jgi:hypothetical protein